MGPDSALRGLDDFSRNDPRSMRSVTAYLIGCLRQYQDVRLVLTAVSSLAVSLTVLSINVCCSCCCTPELWRCSGSTSTQLCFASGVSGVASPAHSCLPSLTTLHTCILPLQGEKRGPPPAPDRGGGPGPDRPRDQHRYRAGGGRGFGGRGEEDSGRDRGRSADRDGPYGGGGRGGGRDGGGGRRGSKWDPERPAPARGSPSY